jgi:predicted branched-subunit amino acid permease
MPPADEFSAPDEGVTPSHRDVTSSRAAFWRGFRELLPVAPGIFAWGLVTGIAMTKSSLTLSQALGMTLSAYAGSAQLAALPLIAAAAPVWVVTITAVIVNLRFVIYSLALRPHFAGLGRPVRFVLGYFTGDITFVKFLTLIEREPHYPRRVAYFAGASASNWISWQVGSIGGIAGAGFIRADSGLELAGTLALIALVVPLTTRIPAFAGVVVAGVVSVLAHEWPLKLGLLGAVVCGIAAAMLAETLAAKKRVQR